MKYLYIAFKKGNDNDGAKVVSSRNLSLLFDIYGNQVETVFIEKPTLRSVFLSLLTLGSYGVKLRDEYFLLNKIKKSNYRWIFIEGSLLGRIVKIASKYTKCIIFAHNIDAKLYKQRYLVDKSFISFLKYLFVSYNEKIVFKNTQYIITLNERDSKDLKESYKRVSNLILPISFPVKNYLFESKGQTIHKNYCLFVGSDFFPNIHGIKWFIQNVSPFIKFDTWIVGSCCNSLINEVGFKEKVHYKGFVENIELCYLSASCVVAPIFFGSGMKTKTIEALSYGKTLFGTNEAFQGLDIQNAEIGGLCNSSTDFINCINKIELNNTFNKKSYGLFLKKYSNPVVSDDLNRFLKEI